MKINKFGSNELNDLKTTDCNTRTHTLSAVEGWPRLFQAQLCVISSHLLLAPFGIIPQSLRPSHTVRHSKDNQTIQLKEFELKRIMTT